MTFHDNSSGQIFQPDFLLVEEALECLGCLMDDGTSKAGKGEVKEALDGRLTGSIRTGVDKGNILTIADPFRCLLETIPPVNYHSMILLRR